MFNINRRYIDFFMKWKLYILIILIMLTTFFFYLLNDNNNDLIQNSQERQSKISDQQIKNSKKLNKKEHRFFISQESDNFNSIASKWLKKDINAEVVEI